MRKKNGELGAVSIFLVIILVPCIVVSSVFVDLGRVQMSKSVAASAGDLALNSLLTHYDGDLNEWYGMVASCQNIEDFYDISAQFFLRTISSQGLSDEEIILLSDYYSDATNDDTIYDLLQMECQTAPSEMISEVEGADLSNPTLIKDQIVEFMKYRAPIEIGTDLISMFRNEDGSQTAMATEFLDSEKNEKLVEEKQDFYEAEGELLKAAYKSYLAIKVYYDNAKDWSSDTFESMVVSINSTKSSYEILHDYAVEYLANTSGLKKYERVTTSDLEDYSYSAKVVCTSKEERDSGKGYIYTIESEDVVEYLNALEDEIDRFTSVIESVALKVEPYLDNLPGNGVNDANAIQWWVQIDDALHGSTDYRKKVIDAGNELMSARAKVEAILKCQIINHDIEEINEALKNANEFIDTYLEEDVTSRKDTYLMAVNKLESISEANISKISAGTLVVPIDGQSFSFQEWVQAYHIGLNALHAELKARSDELDIAINGKGIFLQDDYVPSLDKLLELAKTYEKELGEWNTEAAEGDTTLKKADYELINGDPSGGKSDAIEKINEASVKELKTRLENIKKQIDSLITQIESMKYGNTKLLDIETVDDFLKAMKTQVKENKIPLTNGELKTYAETTYSKLASDSMKTEFKLDHLSDNDYNPNIDPTKETTPELFRHFHSQYQNVDAKKYENSESDQDDAKKDQKTYEETAKAESSEYRGEGSSVTQTFEASGLSYSLLNGTLGALTGLINDIVSGEFDNIRDDLYVTTYVMNMFSYATYDREGMYSLLTAEQRANLAPSEDGAKIYESADLLGKAEDKASEDKHTWLSEDLANSYNKSLTNKMINKDNNAAYLAEVEYILYGNADNAENVKAAFGHIYTIRVLLNTISAFQHFWGTQHDLGMLVENVADGISGATGFVVPVFVIKAVLLPILAAIESCKDNARLSYGMPVELYKAEAEDWWISSSSKGKTETFTAFLSGLTGGSVSEDGKVKTDPDAGKNKDEGLFYRHYLMFFLYSALNDKRVDEKENTGEELVYKRIAEVIQTNIANLQGTYVWVGKTDSKEGDEEEQGNKLESEKEKQGNGYSLQRSLVYFQLTTKVRVKPLLIALPLVDDSTTDMREATDWCTYDITITRGYS